MMMEMIKSTIAPKEPKEDDRRIRFQIKFNLVASFINESVVGKMRVYSFRLLGGRGRK